MQIHDFRPLRKNTLHESHGKRWFSFPGRPMLDKGGELMRKDGKVQYALLLEIPDRGRMDKLQALVVALTRDIT